MGDEEATRKVLIHKEEWRLRYGKLNLWSKLWKRVLGVTIGYGYKPGITLIWMLGFIILGTVMFHSAHMQGALQLGDKGSKPELLESNFCPFVYSIDLFFPIIDLDQDKHWTPSVKQIVEINKQKTMIDVPYQLVYRIFYWFYIIAGWILSTLLGAGLIGILKKE